MEELAFADREFSATRIRETDLGGFRQTGDFHGSLTRPAVAPGPDHPAADSLGLSVTVTNRSVTSLEVSSERRRLLKRMDYDYEPPSVNEPPSGKSELLRERVFLAEQPVTLALGGDGLKIRVSTNNYRFTELEGARRSGGRTSIVEFASVSIRGVESRFPAKVEVRNAATGELLRCARLANYTAFEARSASAWQLAADRAKVPAQVRACLDLIAESATPGESGLSATNRTVAQSLLASFEQDQTWTNATAGEVVRHLSLMMHLHLLLGSETAAELEFRSYLEALGRNDLGRILLGSGARFAETACSWAGIDAGRRLIQVWRAAAVKYSDSQTALIFATRELDGDHFWTAYSLLDEFRDPIMSSAESAFEALALQCLSLRGLQSQLHTPGALGAAGRAQVEMAKASITDQRLAALVSDDLEAATKRYAALANPTARERELFRRLSSGSAASEKSANVPPRRIAR